MSVGSKIDIPHIVRIYRSLDAASDSRIDKFLGELEPHHVKWIVSRYLKQFLPYYHDKLHKKNKPSKRVICPAIDEIHCKNLDSIQSNSNDCFIFEIMNKTLVNKYFSKINNSSNPLSINTTSKSNNKCSLLKLVPKNLLSYIISYLSYYDRSNASNASYCLYEASNVPIGKHDLQIGKRMLEAAEKGYISMDRLYGFRRTQIERHHLSLNNCKKFVLGAYIDNLTEIDARYLNDLSVCGSNTRKLRIITGEEENLAKVVNQLQSNVPLLKRLSLLSLSSYTSSNHVNDISEHRDAMNSLHNSLTTKLMLINEFRLGLKYFELNICSDYNWDCLNNYSSFILFNIHKFINLETLKLDLCFPQFEIKYRSESGRLNCNCDVSKYVSPIRRLLVKLEQFDKGKNRYGDSYKMDKLKIIETNWYYAVNRIEFDQLFGTERWYNVYDLSIDSVFGDTLYVTHPSVWNIIIIDYIEYLMHLTRKNGIKQFRIKCPQWIGRDDGNCGFDFEERGRQLVESIFKIISNTNIEQISFPGICDSILFDAMLNGSIPFISKMDHLKQISVVNIKLDRTLDEQFFQFMLKIMIALSGTENKNKNKNENETGKSLS